MHTTYTHRSSSSSLAARELAPNQVANMSTTGSRADCKLDSVMEFGRELVCDLLASWTA